MNDDNQAFPCDACGTRYTKRTDALHCAEEHKHGTPIVTLETFARVAAEVVRARRKFPDNAKLLAALVEEVGELAQALLQDKPRAEIVKEAIQVACVAIRIAEEGDSDFDATKSWNKAP